MTMRKQVVELQDGEYFVHTYDLKEVNVVVRQECIGGGETGVLDCVITRRVGHLNTSTTDEAFRPIANAQEERCNPYATVIVVNASWVKA